MLANEQLGEPKIDPLQVTPLTALMKDQVYITFALLITSSHVAMNAYRYMHAGMAYSCGFQFLFHSACCVDIFIQIASLSRMGLKACHLSREQDDEDVNDGVVK